MVIPLRYHTDMETTLDFALAYAGAGYRVIPVRGKIPLTLHGAHDATADETTIRAWWAKWPRANIALALAGLVVVDIDPRNGGDVYTLPYPLPATCLAKTGGGGQHYIFKARAGAHYPGRLAQGVDQKTGAGAYIVVAPSVHASGNTYQWQLSPLTAAPADAPEWLENQSGIIARKKSSAPAAQSAARAMTKSIEWVMMNDDELEPSMDPAVPAVTLKAWLAKS